MNTIRASALNLARACPGSWRLREERGAAPPTPAMLEGTRMHRELAEGSTPEARDFVAHVLAELAKLGCAPEARISVEVPGAISLDADGTLSVTGTADVVASSGGDVGTCLVLDYKSGSGAGLEPIARDLQMLTYGVMFRAGAVVRLQIAFEDGAYRVVRHDLLAISDLLEAFEVIATVARAALEPDAPLLPGAHCAHCRSRSACPAQAVLASHAEGDWMVESPTDARLAALALYAGRGRLKALDASLRSWVEAHGPASDGERSWGPRTVEKESVVSPALALSYLHRECGELVASAATTTTKALIIRALRAGFRDPSDVARIISALRADGSIAKVPSVRWGWSDEGEEAEA